ncbi:putative Ig domain-containing protein [Microbacterium rhizomatis]|uniref:Uncharacterized protein n=1 Tax=Microbacterium rhizomatis TaxID=1631477 RepID=A0A5J5J5D3_9MICO|nr:putative Ig domain-containing protein [Microbacterium rhizomatis]KAA9111306.1 hypothetical protein F6B43_06885 [Microbacterium rhizomatis]
MSGVTVAAIASALLIGGGWASGADRAFAETPATYTYIADTNNNRVVKLAPDGRQTTVGSGLTFPSGVAVDESGQVYIADTFNSRVVKVAADGSQTTVTSDLSRPFGVAVDASGAVYIADTDMWRVVKIATDGTPTTVGTGLRYPYGVAVDQAGAVYIADSGNHRVLKVASDGTETTVGTDLNYPQAVAVDDSGTVYIADQEASQVVKVAPDGSQTYVGMGVNHPFGVAVDDSGAVYIANTSESQVLKIAADGVQTTVGDGLAAPEGVAPGVSAPVQVTGVAPAGTTGVEYSFTYTRQGIPLPDLSVTAGALPPGLSLSADGVLSGTPTQGGTFTFTITGSNGVDPDVTLPVTLDVNAAPTIAGSPPPAVAGEAYSFPFTTSGFPAPDISLTAGSLPPGLSLSVDGVLSGTPTQAGTFEFTVTASNGFDPDASLPVSIEVSTTPTIAGSPPAAVTGTAYAYPFTTSGFPAPHVSLTAGSLPPGLTLAADGTLSGTPTQTGSFAFTVTASNGTAPDASLPVTLNVNAAPVIPSSTPSGTLATTGSSGTPLLVVAAGLLLTAAGATLTAGRLRRRQHPSR